MQSSVACIRINASVVFFLSMMNEMMQQSVRSPTPCADGSESLHRNKSISVCHIKTDDICRQHLECMSCVYEWCIA